MSPFVYNGGIFAYLGNSLRGSPIEPFFYRSLNTLEVIQRHWPQDPVMQEVGMAGARQGNPQRRCKCRHKRCLPSKWLAHSGLCTMAGPLGWGNFKYPPLHLHLQSPFSHTPRAFSQIPELKGKSPVTSQLPAQCSPMHYNSSHKAEPDSRGTAPLLLRHTLLSLMGHFQGASRLHGPAKRFNKLWNYGCNKKLTWQVWGECSASVLSSLVVFASGSHREAGSSRLINDLVSLQLTPSTERSHSL